MTIEPIKLNIFYLYSIYTFVHMCLYIDILIYANME